MTADARFCGNCGAPLRTGGRFCVACGQTVATTAHTGATAPATVTAVRTVAAPPPEVYAATAPAMPSWELSDVAPLPRRCAALIIDSLAMTGVFFLAAVLIALATDQVTENGFALDPGSTLLLFTLSVATYFAYFIALEAFAGATLGKLTMNIGVVQTDGDGAGVTASVVRNVLRIVDGLAGYLVGWVAALRSPHRQRIGDRAAGTLIVRWDWSGTVRTAALGVALLLGAGGTAAGILMHAPPEEKGTVTATLAGDETAGFQPVNPATHFSPTTDVFHLTFKAADAGPDATLRSVWYAVNVGNAASPNSTIDEAIVRLENGNEAGSFRLRRGPTPWPAGDYKVELYLNGELVQTLPFTVAR
ncbi:MAG: RDD family protein [Dehalococcoidia bacterium]